MTFEQRDNSGSLFKNENKQSENAADYGGKCMVGGVEYYFDAWLKRPAGKKPFMSFSFKPIKAADTRTLAERKRRTIADDDDLLVPF